MSKPSCRGLYAITDALLIPDDRLTAAVEQAVQDIRMPASIHGSFGGSAGASLSVIATMPFLIAAALLAFLTPVYRRVSAEYAAAG